MVSDKDIRLEEKATQGPRAVFGTAQIQTQSTQGHKGY